MTDSAALPRHVAVIMDGNGRWAQQRRRPRAFGHKAGQEAAEALIRTARERGVRHLTLFAFSSENWQRPPEDRKSTRLNSSHVKISYAVFCLKKEKTAGMA